jgi:hypothetical protein
MCVCVQSVYWQLEKNSNKHRRKCHNKNNKFYMFVNYKFIAILNKYEFLLLYRLEVRV